jgi:hypothetical protein
MPDEEVSQGYSKVLIYGNLQPETLSSKKR